MTDSVVILQYVRSCRMICKIIPFFVALLRLVSSIDDPIIELPSGKILGRQITTFANTQYYSFQKIPFAAPPVGNLRFKAPQPVQKWDGILNATVLDVSCYQLQSNSPTDSEDCLVINVYTPKLSQNDDELLPVMFYIYGGAFIMGSSMQSPPDLFVDNGVILVTVNYRLGPFGFLSTQDDIIPGNNGLKDQKLAIQWTHDNIYLFGGDPEKITIFGESAGSASVSYQLLSQDSAGLFRAAILESGTFLSPWAYQRKARQIAFHLASLINSTFSNSNDSAELLLFLQSLDAQDLDAATETFLTQESTPVASDASQGGLFAPIVEVKNPDAFLTRKMYGLLNAGNFLKVPTLIGFNSEEGLLSNEDADVLQSVLDAFDKNLDLLVPDDMQISDEEEHSKMGISIRNIYTEGAPFGTHLSLGVRFTSDNSFNRPIVKYADLFSPFADTFFYQFSYDGEIGNISIHYDGADNVGHTEEVFYIFCSGQACNFTNYPENDQITSKRMIKIWTDFAKYKNPTPEPSDLLQNITWPKLTAENGDFLYVDINEVLEIKNHPKSDTLQEWEELYASLIYQDFDTY